MDDFEAYAKNMEEEKFYKFVNDQISEIAEKLKINYESMTYNDLNRKFAEYSLTHIMLLSLKTFADSEYKKVKYDFDSWFAEHYLSIRSRENRSELTAQKWLGQKEIEYMVLRDFKEEYKEFFQKQQRAENKNTFLANLIKAWEQHSYSLTALKNNLENETSLAVRNM